MTKLRVGAAFLVLLMTGCGGGGTGKKTTSIGGAGGDDSSGGAGGDDTTSVGGSGGGNAGTGGKGGGTTGGSSTGGAGGDAGSGGSGNAGAGGSGGDTGGSGGDVGDDAAAGSSGGDDGGAGSGGAGGGAGAGGDVGPGKFPGWYEAEAVPPNEKAPKSTISHGMACPSVPPKPGDNCEAGGGEVNWITEGRQGWLQYNKVYAPADGMYDVTWWYHCGNNDNFGDKHCGGQTNPPTTPAGCRPHQIVVNGVELTGTYHFPCFAGQWITIHAATTLLPLKQGDNSIKVYPKSRDSADMDALQVEDKGKGVGPLIMSNNVVGSN